MFSYVKLPNAMYDKKIKNKINFSEQRKSNDFLNFYKTD